MKRRELAFMDPERLAIALKQKLRISERVVQLICSRSNQKNFGENQSRYLQKLFLKLKILGSRDSAQN